MNSLRETSPKACTGRDLRTGRWNVRLRSISLLAEKKLAHAGDRILTIPYTTPSHRCSPNLKSLRHFLCKLQVHKVTVACAPACIAPMRQSDVTRNADNISVPNPSLPLSMLELSVYLSPSHYNVLKKDPRYEFPLITRHLACKFVNYKRKCKTHVLNRASNSVYYFRLVTTMCSRRVHDMNFIYCPPSRKCVN